MPVPQQDELVQQQKNTQENMHRLAKAYDAFVVEWKKIEADEQALSEDLKKIVDKTQMYNILHKIHSIKE